jgi:hypothetical protein
MLGRVVFSKRSSSFTTEGIGPILVNNCALLLLAAGIDFVNVGTGGKLTHPPVEI